MNREEYQQKIELTGNDESEIHESAEEELEVLEAVEDVSESDTAFASGATLVLFKPGFDVGAFIFLEPRIVVLFVTFFSRYEGWGKNCLTILHLPESLVS